MTSENRSGSRPLVHYASGQQRWRYIFPVQGRNISSQMPTLTPPIRFSKHDDVIKWKHFPRYWPFVRGIHRSPVNSPQKGQWRGALMLILICTRINGWVNNREAGDLRRYRAHYDVIVMTYGLRHVWPTHICHHAELTSWRPLQSIKWYHDGAISSFQNNNVGHNATKLVHHCISDVYVLYA